MNLMDHIRNVPDFPKKGIVFRDITTLIKNNMAMAEAIDKMYDHYKEKRIDKVVSVESRGYILGAPLAYKLGAGFVPVRKPGKLPAATIKQEYELEYGTDAVEIHKDAISSGEAVLVHDDLLATGGTIAASCQLVERLGGRIVGLSFLIELAFLQAREKLSQYDIYSLIKYDHE
jgi:adenine phosphoribosyltransferase